MIFSTSNREVEISKANDDSYFRKSDVVDLIIDSEENDGTIDSMVLLEKLRKLPTIPQTICDNDCEHCSWVECPLPEQTIPQTDLTYDMVEQYAKENGFVIWTKEQTEDTLRKLLNYMDTEKQTEEYCDTCKEYDKDKHCCHRFSRVIKDTLDDKVDSVLEDIKAEIEDITTYDGYVEKLGVLEIIDKYISRKE